MSTGSDPRLGPRDLGVELQRDPLVGLDAEHQRVGLDAVVGPARNRRCGTSLNWIAISVTRLGSRLPARR